MWFWWNSMVYCLIVGCMCFIYSSHYTEPEIWDLYSIHCAKQRILDEQGRLIIQEMKTAKMGGYSRVGALTSLASLKVVSWLVNLFI
jgi:hypothetical protein